MNAIQKKIIEGNEHLTDRQLLNWAMNQLFRAARMLDILSIGHHESLVGNGCDAAATVILKRLVKNKRDYEMIKRTNPKLLRGYKNPLK